MPEGWTSFLHVLVLGGQLNLGPPLYPKLIWREASDVAGCNSGHVCVVKNVQRRPLPINGWTSPLTPTASEMLLVIPPVDDFGRRLTTLPGASCQPPPPTNLPVNFWTTRQGNTSCKGRDNLLILSEIGH